jgi:hypothetical protein
MSEHLDIPILKDSGGFHQVSFDRRTSVVLGSLRACHLAQPSALFGGRGYAYRIEVFGGFVFFTRSWGPLLYYQCAPFAILEPKNRKTRSCFIEIETLI